MKPMSISISSNDRVLVVATLCAVSFNIILILIPVFTHEHTMCVLLLCQMNSIIDVTRPLFGQLQKLTDTDTGNVHVSATQSTQTYKVSKLSVAAI